MIQNQPQKVNNKAIKNKAKKNRRKKETKQIVKGMQNMNFSKNNKKNKKSRGSVKQMLSLATEYQHSYARSLITPEFGRGSKIPSIFPQPTTSTHKHLTIPFTASSNGKAAILWNPYFLVDQSTNYSWLAINNSTALTLTSTEVTTGYSPIAMNFGVPANIAQTYRLVSASIRIDPQMSLQTAQGSIGGGIIQYTGQAGTGFVPATGGSFLLGGVGTVSSNIDNSLFFAKANVTALESIRHIYFPFDPSYEMYVPMNVSHSGLEGGNSTTQASNDFFFAYYITGAPANANFNIEIYVNFEIIPSVIGEAYLPMESYVGEENSSTIIKALSGNEGLVTQIGNNISTQLESLDKKDFPRKTKQPYGLTNNTTGGLVSDVTGFLMDHGPQLCCLASSLLI